MNDILSSSGSYLLLSQPKLFGLKQSINIVLLKNLDNHIILIFSTYARYNPVAGYRLSLLFGIGLLTF